MGTLLKRKRKKAAYSRRRDVFTRYINEVVEATRAMAVINKEEFRKSLVALSKSYTAQADLEFDEHGKIIRKRASGNDLGLADTIVFDRDDGAPSPQTLFDVGETSSRRTKRATPRKKTPKKTTKRKRKR